MQGAPVSPTASASGSDLDLPDIAVHEEPLCNSPYQYSAEELAKLYRDAQAEIEKHQAASRYFEQELAAAKHDTMFFRSAANDKDNQIRKLREQLDQSQSEVKMLKPENAELRKTCSKLQLQKDSAADKLSDAKRELSDIHQKLQREVTDRKQAQQQLDVLTQHFSDEEVRKGGSCSVAIKFDTQQRQQLYTHAVRTLLQPIEDKYALGVEVVQTATACNFLLYVTFSSTDRLVNFDEAAFERFKQQCSVGEQLRHIMWNAKCCKPGLIAVSSVLGVLMLCIVDSAHALHATRLISVAVSVTVLTAGTA